MGFILKYNTCRMTMRRGRTQVPRRRKTNVLPMVNPSRRLFVDFQPVVFYFYEKKINGSTNKIRQVPTLFGKALKFVKTKLSEG